MLLFLCQMLILTLAFLGVKVENLKCGLLVSCVGLGDLRRGLFEGCWGVGVPFERIRNMSRRAWVFGRGQKRH